MSETTREESVRKSAPSYKFKKHVAIFIAGVVIALVGTTAIRFALLKDTAVHYHANFALYINGQKDEFKSFTFYEEVASCDAHADDNPKVRTHMHDNKNHLIHVHDGGVTWGQFFANLGYTLGDDLIATDNGSYITGDDGNKLTFYLNGQKAEALSNKVIKSEDVLLINYGKDEDATLKQRYSSITRDAGIANTTKDPAACSGAREFTNWNRFKQALGFQPGQH